MKKFYLLMAIIPLLSLSLQAQKQSVVKDSTHYYKITESYYDHADSSYNLTEYFDEGFLTVMDNDKGGILTIEKELTRFLTYGDIKRIKKPDFAENDSAIYFKYEFDGEVFDDSEPALVLKERIDGSYKKYGTWFYFWSFLFADRSQLQIYGYDAYGKEVMDYVTVDSSFFKCE